jgi:aspartate--ammonia ligase
VVKAIVGAICDTLDVLKCRFPNLSVELSRDVTFVSSQELENEYPDKTSKEREQVFVQAHKTVCILGIGDKLKSGKPHDMRAPDYDDWGLNCDILFWHEALSCAMEISSMGIRVDESSMRRQLKEAGVEERASLPFHKALLSGELPLTMGGGIGQSRLSMLLLGKAHIGEVQVSLWDEETRRKAAEKSVVLL